MKTINTPLGDIGCEVCEHVDWPSVSITVDGVPVATLEYEYGQLRLFTYTSTLVDDDDPFLTILRTKRDEVQDERAT